MERFLRVLREQRLLAGLVTALVVVAIVVLAVLLGRSDPPADEDPEEPPPEEPEEPEEPEPPEEPAEPEPPQARHPLTGVLIDEVPARPALVVKVSNSPEARPQTGLERADVVFEELTEGGITRFAAVFHHHLPEVVGPVRSARPVDIQLISGFGHPGFAHSGARREVRDLLARTPAAVITEGAPGFFRDRGTYASHPYAPHDLFLRTADALEAVVAAGARPLADVGWAFAEEPPPEAAADGSTVTIEMSRTYRTTWTYDPAAGHYRREQNGVPSQVTGEGRIGAANVVVVAVRHYTGASGYPETDVVGEGDAIVLRDGHRYPARWSKPTATDPIVLLTEDGQAAFPLRPGPTWIHLPDHLPD